MQTRLTLRSNLLLAVLLTCLTPLIFGIKNLDSIASSYVLERFVALTGIVLLTPLFLPEQDENIKELTEAKYSSPNGVCTVRILLAVAALLLLISGFIGVMLMNSCEFNAGEFILGTFATAFFLGASGFLAYALSNNVVIGYLVPVCLYMVNMFSSSGKMKSLYLFSLSKGSLNEKYWLLGIGAAFIVAGLAFKWAGRKMR